MGPFSSDILTSEKLTAKIQLSLIETKKQPRPNLRLLSFLYVENIG